MGWGIIADMPGNGPLELLLPRRCVGCAASGVGWCVRCRSGHARPERLPRPSRLARVGVYAITEHTGSARAAVLAYKERNRRDLAGDLAAVLAEGVLEVLAEQLAAGSKVTSVCLVPAPSGRRAAVARGGSHMRRLAHRCAVLLAGRLPVRVADPLRLTGQVRDSVGLDQGARLANLSTHLRVNRTRLPEGGEGVVLLDDVVTTGATATACVRALRAGGARPLAALALTTPGRNGGVAAR